MPETVPAVPEPSVPEPAAPEPTAPDPTLYPFAEEAADRRRLRAAVAVAVVFHLALLALPVLTTDAAAPPADERALLVVQQVRFKPPPPPPPETPQPQPEAVEIPVPDPTPEELEPIRRLDDIAPLDAPIAHDWVAEIPAPPPPPPDPGPILVGGDVARPRGIHTPLPVYTEIARRARLQGMVILQVVLDREGRVTDVEVLRDLPFGLTESAVETVSTWRYEPATLNGNPVEVYMTVTVNFTLQ